MEVRPHKERSMHTIRPSLLPPALLAMVVALAAALPAGAPAALAEVIQVPGDAPTIAGGLALAGAGDEVQVAAGLYAEHDLAVPPGVTLRGAGGVIIDAEGNGRVLSIVDGGPATVIEGLVIRHGSAPEGGQAGFGGGLYCSGGDPVIRDCEFRENGGGYGGAVACDRQAAPLIEGCLFYHNVALATGGGLHAVEAAAPRVVGCTFSGNYAQGSGGAVHAAGGSRLNLEACSFVANAAEVGAALSCWDGSSAVLTACLLTDNQLGAAVALDLGSAPTLSCCDIHGNEGGDWLAPLAAQLGSDGNISSLPQFCSLQPDLDRNWRLQSDSPCLGGACGQIGAWGQGCHTVGTAAASWGELKTRYR
jgi:predicted outer membrane repeat protein